MNNTEKLFHYLGKALGWEYENDRYEDDTCELSMYHDEQIPHHDSVTLWIDKGAVFSLEKSVNFRGCIHSVDPEDTPLIHRVQILLQNYGKTPLEIAKEVVGDTFSIYAISDESFEVGGILEYHDGKININSSFEHSNLIHQLLNRLQP